MSKSIANGESKTIYVEAGQYIKIAWLGGTYTLTAVAGGLPNLPAVQGSANSDADQTFGPYATAVQMRLTVSAIGRAAWDTGVTPEFQPPGEQFVRQSDGMPVTLTGLGANAAFSVDGGGNSTPFAPGAPAIGTAAAGNGTVTLPFTAPASPGASAILDYQALLVDGSTQTVSASPAVFAGKTNGTPYVGAVRARNTQGYGPYSAQSNSVTPVGLSSYLGQVAKRSWILNRKPGSTFKQGRGKLGQINVEAVTSIQLVFANWFVSCYYNATPTYLETGSGGNATWAAAIEYPAGTFTQVKFGGSATGSVADGANLISDALTISIPANTQYWIHSFQQQIDTGFIVYNGADVGTDPGAVTNTSLWGDKCDSAASGMTDITMSGSGYTNNLTGSQIGPILVLANMTKPSVMMFGNSIDFGQNGAIDALGVEGITARSLATGNYLGLLNMGISGDQWSKVVTSKAKRQALAAYFTHIVFGGFTNDSAAGRTSAQILADLQTVYALFPSQQKYQITTPPYGSGAAGTNVAATNGVRVTANTAQKAGVANILATFDVAGVLESPTVSGTWQYAGDYDAAGTHPSQQGYIRVANSGVINPALLTR